MTIEELQKVFNNWRKNKKSHRDRIPEEYWEEATKLAANSTPANVANKLRLNVYELKKRMGISAPNKKVIFKELPLPLRSIEKQPIFELTTASGITLKVYQ